MRAGRLDRRITVQRKATSFGDSGAPVETWTAISQRRPASRTPMRGDERFQAQQFVAREQVEFRVRYGSSVTGLSPLDRVIYPAPLDPNEQADGGARTPPGVRHRPSCRAALFATGMG